jgi:hypothetical protein
MPRLLSGGTEENLVSIQSGLLAHVGGANGIFSDVLTLLCNNHLR